MAGWKTKRRRKMGSAYNQAKFTMEWRNAIGEAIDKANRENVNQFFHIQNQAHSFEKEGYSIYSGIKSNTFIEGRVVSFWLGIYVTSQTEDNGGLMLYFDEDTNHPDDITEIKNKCKDKSSWEFSTYEDVPHGAMLLLKKDKMANQDKADTVHSFFTEAVNVLRPSL
jgi:hypothetical protein